MKSKKLKSLILELKDNLLKEDKIKSPKLLGDFFGYETNKLQVSLIDTKLEQLESQVIDSDKEHESVLEDIDVGGAMHDNSSILLEEAEVFLGETTEEGLIQDIENDLSVEFNEKKVEDKKSISKEDSTDRIELAFQKFSTKLCRYFVSGDFIECSSKELKKVKKILQSDLPSVINETDINDEGVSNLILFKKISAIQIVFKRCIFPFFESVNRIKEEAGDIVFKEYYSFIPNNDDYTELYCFINLLLLEYQLSEDISFYKHLQSIEKIRNDYIANGEHSFKFNEAFDIKIKFLAYKWKKRHKYNKRVRLDNSRTNNKFIFIDEVIDLSKAIKIGDAYYDYFTDSQWLKMIDFHYFDEVSEEISLNTLRKACTILNTAESISSIKIFMAIKYFKDHYYDPTYFELIGEKIKAKYKDNKFYNLDYKKNHLYYANNRFSFYLENQYRSKVDVKALYALHSELQKDSNNNNFFVEYKYLDFCLNDFEKRLLKVNIDFVELETLELELNEYSLINSQCKEKVKGVKNSIPYLFNFDKEDCLINIDYGEGDILPIYFPSCFLLPFALQEGKKLVEDQRKRLYNFRRSINLKKQQVLKEKIKKSEKRAIELITIFTAIISFIITTVTTYKNLDDVYSITMVCIGLAIVLSIFVFIVLFYVKEDFKPNYSILVFVYLLLIGGFYYSGKKAEELYILRLDKSIEQKNKNESD